MLHRSFKSAKCKTSLKLAASRIKLLKNKKGAQLKQLKRELAQLLESGQDQTARIRVEHAVREEKTMAAYDLLEIYCELIVARLPIIESQKNCPIDLKEAISSVVFASPRCADVPELMDVRKHFTAKYGKEFVSAAVELRPDCGVSRLLVEKLSAKAPDGPTKIKILSAIAEEHNIKWDPKSFGEKDLKPSEDLLNGPNTVGNSSQMFTNPSYVQAPPEREDEKTSHLQVSPKSNEKHDVPVNFHEHNVRPSPSFQTDSSTNKANDSPAFHTESMPSGCGTESMGSRHSYAGDENAHSMGRHNWNMEFKDATAAAQAAAESAERASMAARAAAELSSRSNTAWQYSAESQRAEEPHRYADSTLQSEHHAKGPINITLHGKNSGMNYEQINGSQQSDMMGSGEKFRGNSFKSTDEPSRSASLKSSASSVHGDPLVNNLSVTDRYSRKNSSELEQGDHIGQVSFKKQSSRSEVDYTNELQGGLNPKNVSGFEEVRVRKHISHVSSHSTSSTFGDDHNVVSNLGGDADENPFAVNNLGTIQRNSTKSSSPENVVFDDYGFDQDKYIIDLEGKHREHDYLDFSSYSTKSSTNMFTATNAWSERENIDESKGISMSQTHFSMVDYSHPVFSESLPSSTIPSHSDYTLPANFDDSDASISETEEEPDNSKLVRNKDTNRSNVYCRTSEVIQGDSHGFGNSSFMDKENEGSGKPWSQSLSFNAPPLEVHSDVDQGTRVNARSARKFGYRDETTSHSSLRFAASTLDFNGTDSNNKQVDEEKHQTSDRPSRFSTGHEVRSNFLTPPTVEAMEDAETLIESSLESGKELNFGILTGGLRNKVYKRPQYIMSPSHNPSSSKQTTKDTSTKIEELPSATVKVSNSTGASSQGSHNREVRTESYGRTSTGASSQGSHNREVRTESYGRTSTGAHFSSHDDGSYDELPQKTSTSCQERYTKKAGIEGKKRSSSGTQVKYFDSTDSDSEDDFPKEALMSKPHLNTGFSQRTKAKATTLNSEKSSYSNTTVLSEASSNSGYDEEKNYPSRIISSTESGQKPQSEKKSSGRLGSFEKPRYVEEEVHKPIPESKRSFWEESVKPSTSAKVSKPLPKIVTSGSSHTESLKTSSGETRTPSQEKASHVHPKLPDYDTLSAHLQSLRKNRQ